IKAEAPKYLRYEVLDEVRQGLFVDRHCREAGLTISTDLLGQPLRRYVDTSRYVSALGILREGEVNAAAIAGNSVWAGLEFYRELLEKHSYLDYSSILEAAVDALTNDPGLRTRIAARVKHVIVDEYQDVNPIQEAIVRLLHDLGARVCVVGD